MERILATSGTTDSWAVFTLASRPTRQCTRPLLVGLFLGLIGCLSIFRGVDFGMTQANAEDIVPPTYRDHADLSYYLTPQGEKQPVQNVKDWLVRRTHILQSMQQVMGPLPKPALTIPLSVKTLEEVKLFGGLVRRKITFHSDSKERVVHAYLFLPQNFGKRVPAILCLHQTTGLGKGEPAGLGGSPDLQYALELARRGYVTLAPDYPSFGDSRFDFDPRHGYVSGTMKAIYDNVRAVDLLQSIPQVDPGRIGCIGHSLGGHNTMFTAAFEPRIRALVSCCGFSSFVKDDVPSWTGNRYMPRIASVYKNKAELVPFDFPEVVATFAPRPFLAIACTKDNDFDVSGVRDCLDAARPIYKMYNSEANLRGLYPETGHSFPPTARKVAYEFFDFHFKMPAKIGRR